MDPIADMLTIIRNGQAVKKETVNIPYSKIKMEIAKILVREKFLKKAEQKGKKNKKIIDIDLLYDNNKNSAITRVLRVSKPSRRIYLPVSKIKFSRKGLGLQIISTPKGILTDREAREQKVGGEILFKIF